MLDSVQHQIKREHSHTEYGPSAHRHLFPQLHPPLEQSFVSSRLRYIKKITLTRSSVFNSEKGPRELEFSAKRNDGN